MLTPAPQPLSNIQMELLKLYSTGISEQHLLELKELIAKFLFEKAVDKADQIWEKKEYNQDTINKWLAED